MKDEMIIEHCLIIMLLFMMIILGVVGYKKIQDQNKLILSSIETIRVLKCYDEPLDTTNGIGSKLLNPKDYPRKK